jgi:hypothetical protein
VDLEKKRAAGVRLLRGLYDATGGHTRKTHDYWKLGETLGLTRDEISAVADYLVHITGWAAYSSLGSMTITSNGVREVEQGNKHETPTDSALLSPAPTREPPSLPKSIDIDAALKAFAERFSLPADSPSLYARLWQLETWLREMVYVEMKSARGPIWKESLKAVEERIGKDKNLIHMATPQDNPLAYHTLGDLWDIMKQGDNWPMFAPQLPPKNVLEVRLATELHGDRVAGSGNPCAQADSSARRQSGTGRRGVARLRSAALTSIGVLVPGHALFVFRGVTSWRDGTCLPALGPPSLGGCARAPRATPPRLHPQATPLADGDDRASGKSARSW